MTSKQPFNQPEENEKIEPEIEIVNVSESPAATTNTRKA